jgi:hypothetical protein
VEKGTERKKRKRNIYSKRGMKEAIQNNVECDIAKRESGTKFIRNSEVNNAT